MKHLHTASFAALSLALASPALAAVITGPSSSQSPYLIPTAQGWSSYSILTTGDSVGGYQMAGIPDGLGAYDNGDGSITVLMNHELPGPTGGPRAHGAPSGSFVSQFVVRKNDLAVLSGQDLATSLVLDGSLAVIISRLCSADLPDRTAFFNPNTGNGFDGRIFMNGEETGPTGRAFGFDVAARTAYELPALGRFSWENSVANAFTGDRTLVFGTEDAGGGKLHMYLGTKTNAGTSVERAGLKNGLDFVIKIVDAGGNEVAGNEDRLTGLPGAGAINDAALIKQTANFELIAGYANSANGTGFLRPEDFHWDPNNANIGYFVTTDQYDQVKDGVGSQVGRSRLYRIVVDDVNAENPTGRIEMLLSGIEATQMLDNMTVGDDGLIYMQEDTGGVAHNSKIWIYDPATGGLQEIFEHDVARFGDLFVAPTPPFTNNEESSGIIDVTDLFRNSALDFRGMNRFFLADVQAHYPLPSPLVEGGQLLLLVQQVPEPAAFALFGLGLAGVAFARRRRAA